MKYTCTPQYFPHISGLQLKLFCPAGVPPDNFKGRICDDLQFIRCVRNVNKLRFITLTKKREELILETSVIPNTSHTILNAQYYWCAILLSLMWEYRTTKLRQNTNTVLLRIYNALFYTYFPLYKFGCVLYSSNVQLSNFFPKPTLKNWLRLKFEGFLYSK